jgi:hypothetical protein
MRIESHPVVAFSNRVIDILNPEPTLSSSSLVTLILIVLAAAVNRLYRPNI